MSRQSVTALIGLAVFPLMAVAVAAYLVSTNRFAVEAVAGGILVLGAGIFAVAAVVILKVARLETGLRLQRDRLRSLSQRADAAAAQLEDLSAEARQPGLRLDAIMADVRVLRDGLQTLIQRREAPAAAPPKPEMPEPAAPAATASSPPRGGGEHLEMLLEPVIDLPTGTTAHYRVLLDLTDGEGHVVNHDDLMHKADQGGMRTALDAHMVKQVAPVLRRLRVKNPNMRAIVGLGLSTLASRDDMDRVVASLERDVDVAGGIVFEFDHRALGQIGAEGIGNLAKLARLGATTALSHVQVAGLDLASLRQLGVRFLTFPPQAADSGFGPTPAWREFVQYARAMQFQIIISGIATPQQASAATQLGRFGYGPFFAPPRKVRADAGVSAVTRSASAA